MKIKLLTKWYEKEIICCCLKANRCLKDHNCEELTFTLEPTYKGIDECFKNSEKKR